VQQQLLQLLLQGLEGAQAYTYPKEAIRWRSSIF
jgi:hypothetical protein